MTYCGYHKSYRPPAPATADTIVKTSDDMRVSDREREGVVDALRKHTGEGRLSIEEFEERTTEVMLSRTGAELRATLRDLPPLRMARSDARRWSLPPDVMWLAPAVVAAALIAIVGGPVWPLWVVGPWLAWIVVASLMWAPWSRGWHRRGLTHR